MTAGVLAMSGAAIQFWLAVLAVLVFLVRVRSARRLAGAAVTATYRAVRGQARERPRASPAGGRRSFTDEERDYIFARAGHRCEWLDGMTRCRAMVGQPGVMLEADHVIPFARGGITHVDNGQALCVVHNRRKGSKVPGRIYLLRLESSRKSYFAGQLVPNPRRPVIVVQRIEA